MEKDRKLNWKQACTKLNCGKTKFYELINNEQLRAICVGKRGLFVFESDVDNLLNRSLKNGRSEIVEEEKKNS